MEIEYKKWGKRQKTAVRPEDIEQANDDPLMDHVDNKHNRTAYYAIPI